MTKKCVVCVERPAPSDSDMCYVCFKAWQQVEGGDVAWIARRARRFERARAKGRK